MEKILINLEVFNFCHTLVVLLFSSDCYVSRLIKYMIKNVRENKGNNKITELRTILQRESKNS
jgi:hypothetical protein